MTARSLGGLYLGQPMDDLPNIVVNLWMLWGMDEVCEHMHTYTYMICI